VLHKLGVKGERWIVVPPRIRTAVMLSCHDHVLGGHLGVRKTLARVQKIYSWQGMIKDVKAYIRGCQVCQRVKPMNQKAYGFMASKEAEGPGVAVSSDIFGPLPTSSKGNSYALILVDDFTKNVEVYPLRAANSRSMVEKLVEYCCRHGFMSRIRTDNASQYLSTVWTKVCEELSITHRKIVAYRPQGNPSERYIRTVKQCIKAYASMHKNWDKHIPALCFALRMVPSESTGLSPAVLTFGRELRSPFLTPDQREAAEVTDNMRMDYAARLKEQLTVAYDVARTKMAAAREARMARYNQSRQANPFKVGQLVWRRTNILSDAAKGITSGLAPAFEGPFRISKQLGENSYELEMLDGQNVGRRNADQLKPHVQKPTWARDEQEVDNPDSESDAESEPQPHDTVPVESSDSDSEAEPDTLPHKLRDRRSIVKPARFRQQ
jgi:Integrase zinc binding domain/Integrase core domain